MPILKLRVGVGCVYVGEGGGDLIQQGNSLVGHHFSTLPGED